MIVVIDEPQGDKIGGGDVAGPVFARVVARALRVSECRTGRGGIVSAASARRKSLSECLREDVAEVSIAAGHDVWITGMQPIHGAFAQAICSSLRAGPLTMVTTSWMQR